jgi:hypothetical protein
VPTWPMLRRDWNIAFKSHRNNLGHSRRDRKDNYFVTPIDSPWDTSYISATGSDGPTLNGKRP